MSTGERVVDLFRMPALGADMTEGRVVEWLVAEGDTVDRGDLVAVIETDKSDIEVEVFEPCTFAEFVVELGELVQVGEPIARIIRAPGARRDSDPVDHAPEISRSTRRVSPRARRLAAEQGVELNDVDAAGAITGDMIERLSASTRDTPARSDRNTNMRRAIATLMERSWSEIPHYHVTSTLDLTGVQQRLEQHNADRDISDRVVMAAVVNVAVARACRSVPAVNGWWTSGEFSPSPTVDLGLILSLRTGGIVVPTIQQADQLETDGMMQTMRDLVERARRGRLREADLRPASLSITNMGDLGADSVLGVIYPPQVTLVGVGTPRWRPAVVDGAVAPRLSAQLSITGDHRAHDGLIAARLARNIAGLIEELP